LLEPHVIERDRQLAAGRSMRSTETGAQPARRQAQVKE
jgi:hypothetical protein